MCALHLHQLLLQALAGGQEGGVNYQTGIGTRREGGRKRKGDGEEVGFDRESVASAPFRLNTTTTAWPRLLGRGPFTPSYSRYLVGRGMWRQRCCCLCADNCAAQPDSEQRGFYTITPYTASRRICCLPPHLHSQPRCRWLLLCIHLSSLPVSLSPRTLSVDLDLSVHSRGRLKAAHVCGGGGGVCVCVCKA